MIVHTAQTALSPKGQEVSAGVTRAPGGVSPIDRGVSPGNLSLSENEENEGDRSHGLCQAFPNSNLPKLGTCRL